MDGIHYHFSELEAMEKAVARGEFLEYAKVHGNFYGTSSSAVEKVRDRVCVRVCVWKRERESVCIYVLVRESVCVCAY